MEECNVCGKLCDPEETHYVDGFGWVCSECYRKLREQGYE